MKPLQVLFSFLERRLCLKRSLILFVCSLYKRHFFFASRAKTFNMDETDSIVFRRSVYLFILPTNAISQITTYMYYYITTYLIS